MCFEEEPVICVRNIPYMKMSMINVCIDMCVSLLVTFSSYCGRAFA